MDIVSNVDIVGYDLISDPSLSNAGGVAFYIKKQFPLYFPFEALWVQICADGQQNLICGVIYTGCIKKKVIKLQRAIVSELLCV